MPVEAEAGESSGEQALHVEIGLGRAREVENFPARAQFEAAQLVGDIGFPIGKGGMAGYVETRGQSLDAKVVRQVLGDAQAQPREEYAFRTRAWSRRGGAQRGVER